MFVSTAFPIRTFVRPSFTRAASPSVAGAWVDGAYELTADLPGVPEDAVGVSVAGRTLAIDVSADALTLSERIRLPQTLDAEQVTARYANGRLTVTVARTAEATPRSIAIDTSPAPRPQLDAVDAQAVGTGTNVTE